MRWLQEQMYIFFNYYYYEVFLYKGNTQVGKILQLVSFSPNFIVDFKRKLCWLIVEDCIFQKGHKLILHYDIDCGIPLKENTSNEVEEVSENIIKIKKVTKVSADVTKEQIKNSKPKYLTKHNMPPSLMFEKFNAHFVTKTLASPKSTDWTTVIIAVMVSVIIVAFMVIMVFGIK